MSTLNKISLNVAIMLPLIMKPKEVILPKELLNAGTPAGRAKISFEFFHTIAASYGTDKHRTGH